MILWGFFCFIRRDPLNSPWLLDLSWSCTDWWQKLKFTGERGTTDPELGQGERSQRPLVNILKETSLLAAPDAHTRAIEQLQRVFLFPFRDQPSGFPVCCGTFFICTVPSKEFHALGSTNGGLGEMHSNRIAHLFLTPSQFYWDSFLQCLGSISVWRQISLSFLLQILLTGQ